MENQCTMKCSKCKSSITRIWCRLWAVMYFSIKPKYKEVIPLASIFYFFFFLFFFFLNQWTVQCFSISIFWFISRHILTVSTIHKWFAFFCARLFSHKCSVFCCWFFFFLDAFKSVFSHRFGFCFAAAKVCKYRTTEIDWFMRVCITYFACRLWTTHWTRRFSFNFNLCRMDDFFFLFVEFVFA